jgi:uncharacterized protein with GYD domain
MTTYFMFGSYSLEAVRGMSVKRTGEIIGVIEKFGGQMKSMHALLGGHDLVFVADLPDNDAAIKASVALNKMTDISFTTSPAVTVDEFDQLTADI